MEAVHDHRVSARNTATASGNKIHDDVVARRYGFRGGLVPGVDVYAYMAHVPAEAWGVPWLERGSLRARFVAPVYEGDDVTVAAGPLSESDAGVVVPLEVRTPEGGVCAVGEAGLPADAPAPPSSDTWAGIEPPAGSTAADRPPASPETLRAGTALAAGRRSFRAEQAGEYLGEILETLPVFGQGGFAHPGWLLREANRVLSANVALGPWIHVESVTQHHGAVRDGDDVDARARVTREWEHRGHRFVELDVGVFADGDRLVTQVIHTAIYRPRPADT